MRDHTAVAKTFVTAACALAIALGAIGMGVNSSWAGSDQPSGYKFTPISSFSLSYAHIHHILSPLYRRPLQVRAPHCPQLTFLCSCPPSLPVNFDCCVTGVQNCVCCGQFHNQPFCYNSATRPPC
jgi:hypothetical protein